MRRRTFLEALAGSVALALAGCSAQPAPTAHPSTPTPPSGPLFGRPSGIVRVPVPDGTISVLPGHGNLVALTVDDGTDTEVVRAYALLARRTGLRLTFFANGSVPSWSDNAAIIRPLVESGQAIIANHTWSHRDLTKLSDAVIADEIERNERFLLNTFGATGRPFLRPPYGHHNAHVDLVLSALGYPAMTMWYGSLGDSAVITPQQILANAEQWLLPGHLVIGHANHAPVLEVLDQIADLIHRRGLQPVHLADVYDVT